MYTLIRGEMWQFGVYNEQFAGSEAKLSLPCGCHTLLVGTKGDPFLKVSTDQRPISFCTEAKWPGDVISVPTHLICMQLVNKFWHFHKDTPAEMKHFIAFFSPGALNWVALLPSKFYLPGNMQMLIGQLRNRGIPEEREWGDHTGVFSPLSWNDSALDCTTHLESWKSFLPSFKICCVSCWLTVFLIVLFRKVSWFWETDN